MKIFFSNLIKANKIYVSQIQFEKHIKITKIQLKILLISFCHYLLLLLKQVKNFKLHNLIEYK